MEFSFIFSLIVGVVSIVLALVAIWLARQSERRSTENYDRTKDILSEISQKAAVIESTVSNTQEKLVDTVTAIAKPREETQEDIILKAMMQNPQVFQQMVKIAEQQGKKQPDGGNTPKRPRRSSGRRA